MSTGKMNWQNLIDYTIQPSDLELSQVYAKGPAESMRASSRTIGIVSGGQISVVSGLTFKVSAGAGIMPDGTLVTWPDLQATLATANGSQARLDRIELAYAATNNTNVLDVNSQSRVLDIINLVSINVVQGTPSATPVLPAQTGANIGVGYINVSAAMTLITTPAIFQVVDGGFQTSALTLGDKNAFIRYNQTAGALQFSVGGTLWQTFGSGGGGGAGANWVGVAGVVPRDNFDLDERALSFSFNGSEAVSLFVKVPSSYLPGSPIRMKLAHFGTSGAQAFHFVAQAILIRKNIDPLNSITNVYTSTNGDATQTVPYLYQEVIYDLSSTTGTINGIAPSPGDLLRVILTRGSTIGAEDNNDVFMIPSSTEVTFS